MTDLSKLAPGERAALAAQLRAMLGEKPAPSTMSAPLPSAAVQSSSPEPIAIVGIGCRLPAGGVDADSFWTSLAAGKDGMVEAGNDRFNVDDY